MSATRRASSTQPSEYSKPFTYCGCSGPPAGWSADATYASVDPAGAGKRPEARSWLTYPEWYIVYSAESYGRYLAQGKRPSGYSYGRDIAGFWTGLCAVNKAAGAKDAGDAKVMLYTIGLSFSVEMAVKGFYENIFGRIAEWIGGATSSTDKYNAQVWQRYGHFMHETPWYKFDFRDAAGGLWRTGGSSYRDWERRLAIGTEYTVKLGYSKLIGFGAETAMDGAAPTLTFVAKGEPETIAAVKEGMRRVVAEGTGFRARLSEVEVCGKTGSAQVVTHARLAAQPSAHELQPHGWFICFAPADRPKIALAVLVEHGRSGGESAAPVARKILAHYFGLERGQPAPTTGLVDSADAED